MSESLDGVRAFWNGELLLSEYSQPISCPKWFSDALPNGIKLDGELSIEKEQHATIKAIHNSEDEIWKDIKYILYDAVITGLPYEKRLEELKLMKLPTFATVLDAKICLNNDDIVNHLKSIVSNGYRKIILTKPESFYESKNRNRLRIQVKKSLLGNIKFTATL
jgi:DNA ligase-1